MTTSRSEIIKQPYYSIRRELGDAYKVDLDFLLTVDSLIAKFCEHPRSFSISFTNGSDISGENFTELKASPIIETNVIRSISIRSRYDDLFKFSLSIDGRSGISISIAGYGDPLAYEGLAAQLEQSAKAKRPWYWLSFKLWFDLILGFIALLIGSLIADRLFPAVDRNISIMFTTPSPFFVMIGFRYFAFARVEFANGVSKRNADRRQSWQKFIGVTVAVGLLLSFVSEKLF